MTFGPAPRSPSSYPTCTGDTDCMATSGGRPQVCDPYRCAAGGGGNTCLPGCSTDADCTIEETVCGAHHRCQYRTCTTDGDCDAWFQCTGGACARRTCAGDADCHGGGCVDGACYSGPGHCGGGDA